MTIGEQCKKTEMQVQEEMDKKRFSTSAPRGSGATPYTETVEYLLAPIRLKLKYSS